MVELLQLVDLIVNGALLGGLFALMAFGLSIQVGIMRVINIAHGDLIVMSAYFSYFFLSFFKLDIFLSLPIVIGIMFVFGYLIQKFAINRVLSFGGDQPVLLTFALSIIIQNLLLAFFTADARSLIQPYILININVGFLQLSPRYLLGFITAIAAFTLLYIFFKKTYLGKAMRAVPIDREGAEMIGISSKRVYNYATGLAVATASVAGVMLGISFTFYPDSGPLFVLLSFAVIVVGGLGSLRGTLIGGMIVGETLVLGGLLLGPYLQMIAVYMVILIILYIRPQGLFGGRD